MKLFRHIITIACIDASFIASAGEQLTANAKGAAIHQASCYRSLSEMKQQTPNPNAARVAPVGRVAHL